MPICLEHSVGGVQVENFDMEEENEDCEIQKPQMKNTTNEEHIKDHAVNTILIFDL